MKKAIICDIDGTLALIDHRSPYDLSRAEEDLLNFPIANILEVYDNQTLYKISLLLISGRDEKDREITERWLSKYKITNYEALYLRPTGDKRKDTIIKKEIYEAHIKPHYNVLFVLEDRNHVVKMWRDLGLTCLQVAEGNY